MTMNAFDRFPAHLHWTAQQLADAVPPRLSELYAFDGARDGTAPAANREHRPLRRKPGYVTHPALTSRFTIR